MDVEDVICDSDDETSEGHWFSESSGERRESLNSEDERAVAFSLPICAGSRAASFSTEKRDSDEIDRVRVGGSERSNDDTREEGGGESSSQDVEAVVVVSVSKSV